jgi:hypothetical protein
MDEVTKTRLLKGFAPKLPYQQSGLGAFLLLTATQTSLLQQYHYSTNSGACPRINVRNEAIRYSCSDTPKVNAGYPVIKIKEPRLRCGMHLVYNL